MLELERLITDVETEGGAIRGIDLGSIYSNGVTVDASEYRAGLASIVETMPGWRKRCHAMVSGGEWARRYYIAEPLHRCRHHQVYPGDDYCRGEPIDYCDESA